MLTSDRRMFALIVSLFLLMPSGAAFGQTALTRDDRISALREQIAATESPAEKIQLERTLAYLWLGIGCDAQPDNPRFVAEAERILEEYQHADYHYSYLDVKVTYAQLQPAETRESLLWEVIVFDPRDIQFPADVCPTRSVNRLKQGAIWAHLDGATAGVRGAERDVERRRIREVVDTLTARLNETEEGRRCLPLVSWWATVALAEEPMNVPIPVLDAPPPSKWADEMAAKESEPAPAIELPTLEESDPVPEPPAAALEPAWARSRSFDSVEYTGTVTIAEPTPESRNSMWIPWLLGGAGIGVLGVGVVMICRKRSEEPIS